MPGGAVRIAVAALLGLSPILTALGLLTLAEWRDRRRAAVIASQVRLTDAIATELGGVVAPVVSKPLGAPWRVEMPLPMARPALVSRILAITQATLRDLRIARYELVLTPAPTPTRPGEWSGSRVGRLRAARVPSARATVASGAHGGAPTPDPTGCVPRRAARPRRTSSLVTR